MQKTQRFVADQRFDLPQYESMMELIASEFRAYNRAFFGESNLIVRNWKLESGGGLNVQVNATEDSFLFNSENTSNEEINYRAAMATLLTKALEDNTTNYVEVEINIETTAPDTVAIWNTAANSGQGAEFTQSVDTVNCREPTLISNTISYSGVNPNRIQLGRVFTAGGVITNIIDDREFFFHLENDWDFGVTRSDKTIASLKNAFDAITTNIKEIKGTPNWFDDQGITTQNILERLNYMLVDGGTIRWDLPRAASGSLTAVESDPNNGIADGDTFVISDGVTAVTFEFDDDASVGGGNTAVTIPTNGTVAQVRTAIMSAINGHAFNITASSGAGARIELSNNATGIAGNVSITELMANSFVTVAPVGMELGVDTSALSWSADLHIIAPSRAFAYTISAQSVVSINDGDVVYVTLPVEGVAPGGPLVVSRVASASYSIDTAATRNYILAYRSGTKIYFGNGWHGVELEDGEGTQLGDGVSSELLTAIGLPNEFTAKPPYESNFWISPGASHTKALSELDQVAETVFNLVMGKIYEEEITSDGTATFQAGAFISLPPAFGIGPNQTYQTGYNQLEVWFNTGKTRVGEDWFESANLSGGVGDRIQLAYDVPDETKIIFRIQTGGGQTGSVSSSAADVYDEGVLIQGSVGQFNFIGGGVRAVPNGPSGVDITVRASRELGKLFRNQTGATIAAGKAVGLLANGSMNLANAATVGVRVLGITDASVPNNTYGLVLKSGNAAGVLAALTPTPGARVFLSDTTPGEMTLTAPPITSNIIRMGFAEPPDGVVSAVGSDLWIDIDILNEI